MAITVRATMHNGRTRASGEAYCVKHNDRDFNIEHATHINTAPERRNRYFIVSADGSVDNHPSISFEEHEKQVYATLFSESLAKQTERHIKAGHAERIRTMDDYRSAARTCPEETILQLGTKDTHADPQAFIKAVNLWCQQMQSTYGTNWRLIDGALHFDESTPHCHIRAVWTAMGHDGLEVSQTKALAELGIQRPDPSKPQNRYNNPKQNFTQSSRELWISAAREYGIEIEEVPETPGKTSLTKEQYIAQQVRSEVVELSRQKEQMCAEASQAASKRAALLDEVADLENTKRRLEASLNWLKGVLLPIQKLFTKLAGYRITSTRTVLDDILDDAEIAPAYDALRTLEAHR